MGSSFCVMVTNPADVLLQEFAECNDPDRSDVLLESLVVGHALPGVRKIVRYRLAFQGAVEAQDVEDVGSEGLGALISRLRRIKDDGAEAIGVFSGYTAVASYHACNEYLRRKYPNRHRLKTKLRYLLTTEKRFSIWEGAGGGWLGGFGGGGGGGGRAGGAGGGGAADALARGTARSAERTHGAASGRPGEGHLCAV